MKGFLLDVNVLIALLWTRSGSSLWIGLADGVDLGAPGMAVLSTRLARRRRSE